MPFPIRPPGTYDFAFDAADAMARSGTPFCLVVCEPGAAHGRFLTTFKTRSQVNAAINMLQDHLNGMREDPPDGQHA